ncbi:TadE/TadG family type IV pilus assembly protein [Georgenia sp. SYP-B2076]|uniref:TadE/TadG family type IV pilus assembly protein n=1 Tax=Georgenia sp. SYP-B2076 TaxID=2495881 RepID=UPI000F8CE04B|nr:TadE family protein [Georgenia sp. SYP-B2076]
MSARAGERERGSLGVELAAMVPLLMLVTLLIVQGMLAVTTISAVQQAARDGARTMAAGEPRAVWEQAALAQVPGWLTDVVVRDGGCAGACVSVEARVPIGLPSITFDTVTVQRTAEFPRE